MSGQGPTSAHKMRPMKAVKPFILKSSPSPSSPTLVNLSLQRRSPVPDSRHSPDRRSPGSPAKVERPKPVRVSPASSSLRRTSSLDTIGPYLKGQWPMDTGGSHHTQPAGTFMSDKMTQTPDDWSSDVVVSKSEKKKKKHRRSASFGHADKKITTVGDSDKKTLNSFRQKLQKTKDQGCKQRSSPIPANHNALLQTAPAVLMRSAVIHIPKASMPRYLRNSVEGLNPEIENMWQNFTISGTEEEVERSIEVPDGHRAPVPEIRHSGTRSIDTQTPSGTLDERASCTHEDQSSCSPASQGSRPPSISPANIPFMSGNMENSPRLSPGGPSPGGVGLTDFVPSIPVENSPRPSSNYDSSGSTPRDKSDKDTGDSDSVSPDVCLKKTSSSPRPNKIVREPPDGCEKVKAFDEDRNSRPHIKEPLLFCPIKGQGQFQLKPSSSSAFCPLKKISGNRGTLTA